MDTFNQLPSSQEIILNSTPLPARLFQAEATPLQKNRSKIYIAAISVLIGFFIISLVTYKLTELNPESTSAAPPMIIKKTPLGVKEKDASSGATEKSLDKQKPTTKQQANELDELNSIDVGSVEGELKEIKKDEGLL